MKRFLKIAFIALLSAFIMLLTVVMLLKFGLFNPIIKNQISQIANQQLNGELRIGTLKGDVTQNFSLKDIQITQLNETLANIKELKIDFSIWSLLSNTITIDSLIISDAQFTLVETPDSLWNIQILFIDNSEKKADTLNTFTKAIHLQNILISNTTYFHPQDSASPLPKTLALKIAAELTYETDHMKLNLQQLKVKTEEPNFELSHLSTLLSYKDSVLTWNDLKLDLPKSHLSSEGKMPINNWQASTINFKAEPLNFEDLNAWFSIEAEPSMEIRMQHKNEKSTINIHIQEYNQNADINIQLFKAPKNKRPFNINFKANNLELNRWTNDSSFMKPISMEGNIEANDINFKDNTLSGQIKVHNLVYLNHSIGALELSFMKSEKNVSAEFKNQSQFGAINAQLNLQDILGKSNYRGNIEAKQLNFSHLYEDTTKQSNLNLQLTASGKHLFQQGLTSNIQLKVHPSTIYGEKINNLNGNIQIRDDHYQIKQLQIETPYLQTTIKGNGDLKGNHAICYEINSANTTDISQKMGWPSSELKAQVSGCIRSNKNSLKLDADIQINELSSDSLSIQNAHIKAQATNKKATLLQNGFTLKRLVNEVELTLISNIQQLNYNQYLLKDIEFNIHQSKGKQSGKLSTQSPLGNINTNFSLNHLLTQPTYQLNTQLNDINLAEITQNKLLQSKLNITLEAAGTGLTKESIQAKVDLKCKQSSLFNEPIQDFQTRLSYGAYNFSLDSFSIQSPIAELSFWGEGDILRHYSLNTFAELKQAYKIPLLGNGHHTDAKGIFQASVKSYGDSLFLKSNINLSNIIVDTIHLDRLTSDIEIVQRKNQLSGNGFIDMQQLQFQNINIKKIRLEAHKDTTQTRANLTFFASDSLNGTITAQLKRAPIPTLLFPKINLNFQNNIWQNTSDEGRISATSDSIHFQNFIISSKKSFVRANGLLTANNTENFELQIHKIELIEIPGIQLLPITLNGTFSSKLNITGTAEAPILHASITAENINIDTISINSFSSDFVYKQNRSQLTTHINKAKKDSLWASYLQFPITISKSGITQTTANDSLLGTIRINKFNLSLLQPLLKSSQIEMQGELSSRIEFANTFANPFLNGFINLENGSIKQQEFGINYSPVVLKSRLRDNTFFIDTLNLNAGTGSLNMAGQTNFTIDKSAQINNMAFNIKGENFKALNSDFLKTVLNTNIKLSGNNEHPEFMGDVTILSTTFNSDIYTKRFSSYLSDTITPMLVKARQQSFRQHNIKSAKKDTASTSQLTILKELRGRLDINIPGNTWVKAQNMNFELGGKMSILKTGPQIDYYGTIVIKRGYYKIYGKRLIFEEGEIKLTGGNVMNAIINLKIAYSFRDIEQLSRKLNILITGRISNPKIEFQLDDAFIEEKDAMSYLLFQKSTAQLNSGEQSTVAKSNVDIAKDFTLGKFSNLVQGALQSSLNLDVLEIKGNQGWTAGTVSTGKYITKKLYLNYERNFSFDKRDKIIEPQKITLEYQILPYLFLQSTNQSSNSGFDLILKWNWK